MARVKCVLVAAFVLGLAACGSVRPGARPLPPGPSAAPTRVAADGPPAPATVPGPVVSAESGAASLNSRLLSQVSPPTVEADLPIGPGDLIEVSVFEVEELSKLKVRIPLRGSVTLPLLGPIPAAGRTAIELEDEIRRRLQQRFMHNPQVAVFVHEHNSQRISVIGAVRKGGVYNLSSRLRLVDALALAEGLADDADHRVYLIRRVPAGTVGRAQAGDARTKSAVPPLPGASVTEEVMAAIDLEALAGGREELNVGLETGDVIHVPRAGSYYVGGSVERAGSYFLKSKTTVYQAILAAGGAKDVADLRDVRLHRTKPSGQQDVLTLNLNELENGQGAPEIQKGDVVVVGKSSSKVFLYGVLDFFKSIFNISRPL